jgi:elongation factor 2
MYSKFLNINEDSLMKKLWGDYFYDPETKKIVTEQTNKEGKTLQRTFVKFIIDPIVKMSRAIMDNEKETFEELVQKAKVELTAEERKKLTEKDLLKCVMSRWLSAADCLMEMMIMHLPSPKEAQKYRAEYLYEGPTDDEVCESMKNCNPNGPLVVYISKMIPLDNSRFAAFGRIFSGTIGSGQRIKIMGANYKHGHHHDLFVKNVSQVGVYMMGKTPEFVADVPCGNTVAIVGIDDHLLKTGTLGSIEIADSYPIKSMKYSVSPVYKVAVRCKNAADLPKL